MPHRSIANTDARVIATEITHCAKDLENLFHTCFFADFTTQLTGGHREPLYLPARNRQTACQLQYRENYFSSALHEIAHWCIAGRERRSLVDFGYWYEPDGRNPEQQSRFERVEIKPQALEWVFSVAAGTTFRVSSDNLEAGQAGGNIDFTDAVYQQVLAFISEGLPARGATFASGLVGLYKTADPLDCSLYQAIPPG